MARYKTIPVTQYLFNCNSIHGVPGDFFLRALDHIKPSSLKWIGNANEPRAGYAADGYARAGHHIAARRSSRGPKVGALVTTYGVGELSAINAVAGSYAERVPVVHFVGMPSRRAWRKSSAARPVHHSLGDGRMGVYAEMAKQVVLRAIIMSMMMRRMLCRCTMRCWRNAGVPAELLEKPLKTELPPNDPGPEKEVVNRLANMVRSARRPLLVADGLSYPFNFIPEANELAKMMTTACFTSGKGVVDESLPDWRGPLSESYARTEAHDLLMMLGPILSNTNTAAWTAIPEANSNILFNLDSIEIDGDITPLRSKSVLEKLVAQLTASTWISSDAVRRQADKAAVSVANQNTITQGALWPLMAGFLRSDDTVLLANGTPLIGGRDMQLPAHTQIIASSIWCSIGQMLPAAQRIALAKRDQGIPGRSILFEGDGSFQVTCQSVSDIIRYKLDVTVFILNNGGYTYERWLNVMEAEYNDVPAWNYSRAPSFFGAGASSSPPIVTRRVEDMGQLRQLLADERFSDGRGLKIVDVVMKPNDVPEKAKAGLRRASNALKATS